MTDMNAAIIPKSDQLNSDDLIAGPITITVREVHIKGGQEQPVSIFYGDSDKPYKPCKSMSRVLVAMWGADAKVYTGRSLTLYRDPAVKWAGMEVGGIRISHMSHIEREHTMALTATKGSRKPFKVLPLEVAPAATTSTLDPDLCDMGKIAAQTGATAAERVASVNGWWSKLGDKKSAAYKKFRDEVLAPMAKAEPVGSGAKEPDEF